MAATEDVTRGDYLDVLPAHIALLDALPADIGDQLRAEFAAIVESSTDAIARAEAQIAQTSSRLARLVDTMRELATASVTSAGLMELAASKCQDLCSADGAAIALIERDDIVYHVVSGLAAGQPGSRRPMHASFSGAALRAGRALVCDDSETDPYVDRNECRRVGVRSMVVAPLRTETGAIGIIKVVSARPHAFEPRDASNLQLLAESLGALLQRRDAAERMRASEQQYRLLFKHNPRPMWVFHVETLRFLAVNDATVRDYGWSEQEFLAMTIRDIRPAADIAFLEDSLERVPVRETSAEPVRHCTRDGATILVEIIADDIEFAGTPARLVEAHDVTSRVAAELERQSADALIREQASLLDRARDSIIVRDMDGVLQFWNKSAERVYGWTASEALGQPVTSLIYADRVRYDEAMRLLVERDEWTGEIAQVNRAGERLTIEARWTLLRDESGQPVKVLAIGTDVTDRKKLEQQFLRAQRMESLGTLAGGIAHDLNNVLAPIMLAIDLLRAGTRDAEDMYLLDTMAGSAQRGADMVRQVLTFARGMDGQRATVQPRDLVRDIERIARDTFPKNLCIMNTVAENLWPVLGDATQLHQVLLNLCVNARDAMPDGGDIRISAENLDVDAQYAAMNIDAKVGPHVLIRVEDTGTGIPASIIDSIFDPFFTTKEPGKGTGLGLSTLLAILKSHGGFISVYSEPGHGTRFRVYLPARTRTSGESEAATQAAPSLPRGNGELVLVVDDEALIRHITQQTLEAFGYNVLLAADGAEAVAVYAQKGPQIDVVITDMMMPVMDGLATIAALLRIDPSVRIIAASGVTATERVARANISAVKHYLAKPYTADTLLKALRDVLRP